MILSNGFTIPSPGFGTFKTPDGDICVHSVREAIAAGYTHIDTAAVYGNECSVGEGVRQSGKARGELFITSKVWNTERGYDKTIKAVETSLKNSYAVFSVCDGEKVIAMARLIGDVGMAFFLKDLVVAPEYQGQGTGRALLAHIEEFIRGELKEGWWSYLQLMSAKDKEPFYLSCGYKAHPHEHSGAGFTKVIKK